jgi:hypothetical protein
MLDAYTVRKAIPRVVVAVIAINLSIYLCVIALDLTTILGRGINQLIVGPFVNADSFKGFGVENNVENNILGVLGVSGLLAGIVAGGFIAATGAVAAAVALLGMLLPLIITIALIALAVLFTLVIRQGLLIFLVIISPVAIVCYILPGTEKYFKQWWDLFLKTLMIYPIIAAIFAMSNVLAAILLNSASGNSPAAMFQSGMQFAQANPPDTIGTVQLIVAVLVLYAPLVLIPFAFKLAGGAISAVMNVASGRTSNLAGRAGKAIQQNRQDENSWLGGNAKRARSNRETRHLTAGQIATGLSAGIKGKAAGNSFRGSYGGAVRSKASTSKMIAAKQALENNQALSMFKSDDDMLWAAMTAETDEGVRTALKKISPDRFSESAPGQLDQAVAQIRRFQSQTGTEEARIAATMAQASTGTGFNYGRPGDDMLQAINSAAGNDAALAGKMLGEMRGATVQSGRADIGGGGFGTQIKALSALRNGDITVDQARAMVLDDVANSNAGQALTGKPESVKALAPILKAQTDAQLYEPGHESEAVREFASLAGKYDMASSISPNNARALSDGVLSQQIDVSRLSDEMKGRLAGVIDLPGEAKEYYVPDANNPGQMVKKVMKPQRETITYQQAIEGLRGDEDFRAMRREYASETAAQFGTRRPEAEAPTPGGAPPPAAPPAH